MHVVEGERGIVVIDPLISAETAAAALALYREHRGERPVTGLIYTHSHVDHFGGAAGIVTADEVGGARDPGARPGGLPRRTRSARTSTPARRWAGAPPTCTGRSCRAGPTARSAPASARRPRSGTVDPDPAQPRRHRDRPGGDGRRGPDGLPADARHRGAGGDELPLPRPARCSASPRTRPTRCTTSSPCAAPWSATRTSGPHYLDEAIELFGADSDVLFAGHHWPRWGSERIVELPAQAARPLRLHPRPDPAAAQPGPDRRARSPSSSSCRRASPREWHCRGYYGSVSHNVKAVYQRYMGWFDGNPAHLWEHPPVESARALRRVHGRRRGGARAGARVLRGGRLPLGRRGRQPRRLRRARQRGGPRAAGRRAGAARLRRRERDLAQLLPDGRQGAARGHRRHPDRHRARPTSSPSSRSSRSSTRWRSGSTARAPGSVRLRINWQVTDPDERAPDRARERRPQPPPRATTPRPTRR